MPQFVRSAKLFARGAIGLLPLPVSRRLLYRINYGSSLNLENPRSFNEKVNWRIVYDRRPVLPVLSSKVLSKDYVRSVCPEVRIPRTLWHGDRLEDLRTLDVHGQWVLKASHRSGDVIFGEGAPDVQQLRRATKGWLRRHGQLVGRQWAYSQVRPEYILEERIGAPNDVPADYKMFVFHGSVELIQVDRGRFGEQTRNLYTREWEPLPFTYTWRMGPVDPPPQNLLRMVEIAAKVGAQLDFVRVDLFNVEGEIFFGETTVYPAAGLSHWPRTLDESIGRHWHLPSRSSVSR